MLLAGTVTTVLIAAAIASLVFVSLQLRDELGTATSNFLEEQRIADDINAAVMRQLALASAFPGIRGEGGRSEFLAAGEEVHRMIRQYLFRDLHTDERLQLERIRAEHQSLEVAAIRAAEQFGRGLDASGGVSMDAVVASATTFVEAVNEFLRMREQDIEALRRRQDATFRMLYIGGAGVAFFSLLALLAMAWDGGRRVRRPLAELAIASERMAAGDLTARVVPGPDLELRTLGRAFNRMAESLEHTARELEDRNAKLEHALEAIQATQFELIQAEKLSAIGRMTAGFAHEINNPLTSVLGYAQLLDASLEEGTVTDVGDLRREYLGPLLREGERARHLVRTLLRSAREPEANLGPVRLREVVDVVHTLRVYSFEQAGLGLVVDVPDVLVIAEPQMLQSAVLNIVNNALDAMSNGTSGPGGAEDARALVVRGHRDGDMVELIFEDDGPGFENIDRVFEPFFTTKPVGEGTGLGLALVHQYMVAFGGTVAAANRPDAGARITLHLRAADAPATADVRAMPDVPAAPEVPAGRPDSATSILTPSILVVEDEPHLRRLQERILDRIDARVSLAESVSEAREILLRDHVDLIISDIRMPGESGLELFEWVQRERPELADRFLFVSGDISAQELAIFSEARPDRLLQKPFQVDEYLARVTAALE
jgi:C4-dicarboxylate-specific signal transduction histidine kinase